MASRAVCAFDLLHGDGTDLTPLPLSERRAQAVDDTPSRGRLQLSPVARGDPRDAFAAVCNAGGEGLISKRVDAPYRCGRSRVWLKVKCARQGAFLIVGFQPTDKRGRAFASLVLAEREDGRLAYRGKVGAGFGGGKMEDLAIRLQPLVRRSAPLDVPAAEAKGMRWLDPSLAAEVRYADVTADGRLRHASFIALREGEPVREVRMREAENKREKVAGIGISSGERVVFPKPRVTKIAVARYYAEIADRMLEEAADRPVSLLRLPEGLEGERFFQKHAGKGFPDAIATLSLTEADGDAAGYMYISDAAGLVAAAQMGTIEFHIWGARRDRLERPDRMVFDLDPDEGLAFSKLRKAALEFREDLAGLGLPSYAMVTGGKGVHVVVPLRRVAGWETVKLFARTFAAFKAESDPRRYTAEMAKSRRKGRIFVDWLRNERGATAVAPFSIRARPGAPVAVPVSWDELAGLGRADAYSMNKALDRSWADLEVPKAAGLTDAVIRRLEARLQ